MSCHDDGFQLMDSSGGGRGGGREGSEKPKKEKGRIK